MVTISQFRNCDIVTMIRVFIQSLQHDIPDQEQHDAGYGYVDQQHDDMSFFKETHRVCNVCKFIKLAVFITTEHEQCWY